MGATVQIVTVWQAREIRAEILAAVDAAWALAEYVRKAWQAERRPWTVCRVASVVAHDRALNQLQNKPRADGESARGSINH